MERLTGYKIPFDINKLKLKANLIEQDGPLLSLYYNANGDYYLFYWLDCDDKANRWMILRVDLKALSEYLNGRRTLLDIIEHPSDSFVWITDVDEQGKQIDTIAASIKEIPSEELPTKDSFFEFDNRDDLLGGINIDKVAL